ncbi:hypothetical protein ACH5RR_004507 [Cinchona calisaya]|uniref:HVA22-like protein n=1 Tax=Cinchona calisaya TaxID=153742 RepID=A0ABD3AY80_9GENT
MLGEFITGILVLVLGYAYPAFECFKTLEKNKVEIEELRFWCQYWILVAMVTVLERIGDLFISWLPMYGEMKLALFIYLWYPKTRGSGYVYDTLLKPYMSKHESDIDKNLVEFRARAWDLLVYYWENCTQLGQTTFFQVLDFLATNVGKLRQPNLPKPQNQETPSAPPIPSTPSQSAGILRRHKRRSPPTSPFTTHRSVYQPSVSESVQVHLHDQTQFVRTQDPSVIDMDMDMDPDGGPNPKRASAQKQPNSDHHLRQARLKLRRAKDFH